MQAEFAALDSYEDAYQVDQRRVPGRSKPARRYSPRHDRSSRRGPACHNGSQFRGNKKWGL